MASEGAERRLAAILSADAVGYTRLMAEDEGGHDPHPSAPTVRPFSHWSSNTMAV